MPLSSSVPSTSPIPCSPLLLSDTERGRSTKDGRAAGGEGALVPTDQMQFPRPHTRQLHHRLFRKEDIVMTLRWIDIKAPRVECRHRSLIDHIPKPDTNTPRQHGDTLMARVPVRRQHGPGRHLQANREKT